MVSVIGICNVLTEALRILDIQVRLENHNHTMVVMKDVSDAEYMDFARPARIALSIAGSINGIVEFGVVGDTIVVETQVASVPTAHRSSTYGLFSTCQIIAMETLYTLMESHPSIDLHANLMNLGTARAIAEAIACKRDLLKHIRAVYTVVKQQKTVADTYQIHVNGNIVRMHIIAGPSGADCIRAELHHTATNEKRTARVLLNAEGDSQYIQFDNALKTLYQNAVRLDRSLTLGEFVQRLLQRCLDNHGIASSIKCKTNDQCRVMLSKDSYSVMLHIQVVDSLFEMSRWKDPKTKFQTSRSQFDMEGDVGFISTIKKLMRDKRLHVDLPALQEITLELVNTLKMIPLAKDTFYDLIKRAEDALIESSKGT